MKRPTVSIAPEWIWERWMRVAYLIINWKIDRLADLVRTKPDEVFFKVVAEHVNAYVEQGVMPPDDIATAILNVADDYMAGQPLNLRAGDYIALQNHVRQMAT